MSEPIRILVVEDDPAQRMTLAAVLGTESSYEVQTAENGDQALKLVSEDPPSVIISDIYMDKMDGVELCKKVKTDPLLRETMFILLTASAEVEDKVRGLDSGADDYVTRPVHADELLSRVRASLRIAGMRDELKKERHALAELNKTLEVSYAGVLQLLVQLIGLRIPNATARAERAEKMARWIGERLEMNQAALHILGTAARLHEIGKISFADGLLKKDLGALNENERQEMSNFPAFGHVILAGIPNLEGVRMLIRHQLENYDGTGYPDKLMNQQIPLGSRILRLVNVVESHALSKSFTQQDLLEAIRKGRGTHLDPRIVQLSEEYLTVVGNPSWLVGKRQLKIDELQPGMVLASDLVTGNGTKLLPKDSTVGISHIERILAHHHFDPIVNGIYVYSSG